MVSLVDILAINFQHNCAHSLKLVLVLKLTFFYRIVKALGDRLELLPSVYGCPFPRSLETPLIIRFDMSVYVYKMCSVLGFILGLKPCQVLDDAICI